jgi:nucleoside-diphosphate-sugar epimerase
MLILLLAVEFINRLYKKGEIMGDILITGSCGCIGTALKERLGTGFDEIDLKLGTDHNSVKGRKGTLVYLSSWSEQDESLQFPVKYLDNNLTALAIILSNNSFDKVIFPSSNAVYDGNGDLEPNSVYGLTKLAGEKLIKMLCKKYWIFRFANVYGYNDNRSVFYHLAQSMKEGRTFTIYYQEGMVRDYLSATDAAAMIELALTEEITEGIHNVGTGEGVNITTALERLCIRYGIRYECVTKPKGITNGYIPKKNLLRLEQRDIEEEWEKFYI